MILRETPSVFPGNRRFCKEKIPDDLIRDFNAPAGACSGNCPGYPLFVFLSRLAAFFSLGLSTASFLTFFLASLLFAMTIVFMVAKGRHICLW
jgi:hypothetical protein